MSSRKLAKFALYALQALLAAGAIWITLAILGGIVYLHEAQRNQYEDMWEEIATIFKNEIILVFVGTSLLFGIGAIRVYMGRSRENGRMQEEISQPVSNPN